MTDTPMQRIHNLAQGLWAAIDEGRLPGPPPPSPMVITRLRIEHDGDDWRLTAETDCGARFSTILHRGEPIDLVQADDHRLVVH